MATNLSEGMERLARAGYVAKGVVYITLGVLSVQAALQGGSPEGGRGAVREIAQQPFGMFLLVLTAIGLGAYALWRVVQAAVDPEHAGDDASGVAKRVGYAASGLSYAALCLLAVQLMTGSSSGGSGSGRTYVAQLLQSTVGQIVVVLAGVFVIGVGLHQLYKAKTTKFVQRLKVAEMSASERKAAIWSGRIGLAARGVVFPIMGYFLIRAALTTDASRVKGLGGALREVSSTTYGSILLLVVASGLVAYGVYQLVLARYRRIQAP